MLDLSVSATLLYSIAGAVILAYAPFLVVGFARAKTGYDMSAPRTMLDKLPPYAQRATWAHQNSFEALTIYGLAALIAYATGVTSSWAQVAAIAFLVVRSFYSVFYILDIPLLRSLMFGIGSICAWTLFILSLLKVT
ncbi:MAPEG family protein [Myxosarcina sp. GI1]|uniref:MAPEG family protein n=1 Tax=Myxosarcina sp. GI1 TaxID=1541065 RepID=UPI00056176EF|nr:MAPEG family protein [Myxosarcina sp. GI1]